MSPNHGELNDVRSQWLRLGWERRFCFDASFGLQLESGINGLRIRLTACYLVNGEDLEFEIVYTVIGLS